MSLVAVIVVVVGEDKDGQVDECVQVGDKIEDSGDEEERCGLEWWFRLVKVSWQCRASVHGEQLTFFNT